MNKIGIFFAGSLLAALLLPSLCAAQNWTGSMRCEINVNAGGYTQRETQTWTLTGAAPTQQGAFEIYPATWTVSGQGSFDRSSASSRRTANWTANVPGMNAPISFHVTPTGRRVVKLWHSLLSMHRAYSGTEQYFQQGVPQLPKTFEATVYEWQPSQIEVPPADTRISGSQTLEVRKQVGPVQSPDTPATVVCTWSFGRGSAPALPASTSPPMDAPPGTSSPAASNPVGGAMPGSSTPPGAATPPGGSTSHGGSTSPPGSTQPATPGASAPEPSVPLMTAVPLSPGVLPVQLAQVKLTQSFASYWAKGQEQRVAWTHTLGAQALFDVEASFNDGAAWIPLASRAKPFALSEMGAGVVGAKVIAPNQSGAIRIRVRASGQETPVDVSTYRIGLATPMIRVVAPAAGDRWVVDSATPTNALRLSHNLSAQASFKVELSRDGGVSWAWIGEEQPGYPFVWRIVSGPATTQARIRVTPMHAGPPPSGPSPYSAVEAVSPDFTIASGP